MKFLSFTFILFIVLTSTIQAQDPINVTNLSGDCSNSNHFSDHAFSQYDFSETYNGKPSYETSEYVPCGELATEAQCNTQPGSNFDYIIRWNGTRWEWLKERKDCFWLIDECVAIADVDPINSPEILLLAYNTQDTTTPPETGWIADTGFTCVPAVNTTLGITQTNISKEFSIYPNPSNGKYHLTFLNEQDTVKVNLYNVLGQQIWSKFENKTLGFDFEIDQPNGVYFLELLDKNGKKELIRLIKL